MRIGTRRSALALAQARQVADLLGGGEIVPMATAGDRGAGASDKSRWVAELEEALLGGQIDLAVHSAKDVPGELAGGLRCSAPRRERRREDVLCGARALDELAAGARVGTSSVRRAAQLRAAREDLEVVPLRGQRGHPPAQARRRPRGVRRDRARARRAAGGSAARTPPAASSTLHSFVPAPGQGALALEGRSDDDRARAAAQAITDTLHARLPARRARARARRWGPTATRRSARTRRPPMTATAAAARLGRACPTARRGSSDELRGTLAEPEALGGEVAERMGAAGAAELLRRAQEMAGVASS